MENAIVILNYNDTETTLSYLERISQFSVYDHIIVVDNASTDPATENIRSYCNEKGLDYIQADDNRGYASGNNIGIRHAIDQYGAEIVFVSNPDILYQPESIQKIIDAFSEDESVGMATGLVHVFTADGNLKVYSSFAYRVPTVWDMMQNCLLVLTKIKKSVFKRSMYYDPAPVLENGKLSVEAVSGCFFALRTKVYEAIGGLDEETFLYYEEAILGHRLKKNGCKAVVVNAQIIHDEKRDKARGLRRQWVTHRRNQRSAIIYLKKYLHCSRFGVGLFCVLNFVGFLERYAASLFRA